MRVHAERGDAVLTPAPLRMDGQQPDALSCQLNGRQRQTVCEDLFPLFLWQTLAQQLSGPRLHSACAVGGPNSPPSPNSAPPLPQAPPLRPRPPSGPAPTERRSRAARYHRVGADPVPGGGLRVPLLVTFQGRSGR